MDYTFSYGGADYLLPKFTKTVKDKVDKINKENESNVSDDKKYKSMYEFVKDIVGIEEAKEIFGSDKMDDIDLNEIVICYILITRAYGKPVEDERKKSLGDFSDDEVEMMKSLLRNAGDIKELHRSATTKRPPFSINK